VIGPRAAGTRREAVARAFLKLSSVGVESARLEAERLTAHALGLSRDLLAFTGDEPLTPGEALAVESLLLRRFSGEPLQHIEGTVQFRELELLADRRALIPRPETEQLVEQVICWVRGRAPGSSSLRDSNGHRPLDAILDIGTGSGAIALSLVTEGAAVKAVGLDISEAALEQARENRARAGLADAVEFRSCGTDPYSALLPAEDFDAIISNPPYVSEADLEGLAAEVRMYDPHVALAGGADGLQMVRTVAQGAHQRLRPGGALFLEIGAEQGEAVRRILRSSAPWAVIDIRRDLAGRDRFAVARV
jgi:release factor glutamine methyltransferase